MTDIKRRILLKGSLAASAVSATVGTALLTPRAILAAWDKDAFSAKEVPAALRSLVGSDITISSDAIQISPDSADDGAMVPITVESSLPGIESIAIMSAPNARPLVASFELGEGAEGFVSTRIKMAKTGDVIAVVKANGKLYSTTKRIKVTIGGCGG